MPRETYGARLDGPRESRPATIVPTVSAFNGGLQGAVKATIVVPHHPIAARGRCRRAQRSLARDSSTAVAVRVKHLHPVEHRAASYGIYISSFPKWKGDLKPTQQ
jgi:hypothetical protein